MNDTNPTSPDSSAVSSTDSSWHLEYAWLGGNHREVVRDVLVTVSGGRITELTPNVAAPAEATRLRGLTLPGLANTHSHAFHRALRGRSGGSSFWSWREPMFQLATRLDPDSYRTLARAVYAEMTLAGITCVGEFHYVHHNRDGEPYAEPNAMGSALVEAAADAGLRITLLDTCYLTGGLGDDGATLPLNPAQRRFADASVEHWAARVDGLRPVGDHARAGAAVHSVRAVPARAIAEVAGWTEVKDSPLHVHVSEQPGENAACIAAYGQTPVELLADAGALGPRTTLVHATHLEPGDIELIADARPAVCLCPTTEADLADGIAATSPLSEAATICLGTDSHARVDMFEEARAVELYERLSSGNRGTFDPDELLGFATSGHDVLGWSRAGWLGAGARADLVTIDLDNVRLAGYDAAQLPQAVAFAGTAADVRHVIVDGRTVVRDGQHQLVSDVPAALGEAIEAIWKDGS